MSAVARQRRLRLSFFVFLLFGIFIIFVPSSTLTAAPQSLSTQDLTTLTPTDLVDALVGSGVSVSNVTFTGAESAAGSFTGGEDIVGFDNGIILSSGNIADIAGPNQSDSTSTNHGMAGDADLSALSGFSTYDASVLTFDFVPNAGTLFFRFVFASDEYNEFVNTQFNDVFAFFVNGENCATVSGAPISINTINNGNPLGTNPSNPEFYINNDPSDSDADVDIEADGFTVVLNCVATVMPNETNTLKLAIADATDNFLDSMVLLQAESLTTTPTIVLSPESAAVCAGETHTVTAVVTDVTTAGVDVVFNVIEGPNAGLSAVVTTDEAGQASWSYSGASPGMDRIEASFVSGEGATIASLPVSVTWEACAGPTITLVPELQFVCLDDVAAFFVQIADDDPLAGVEVTLEVLSGPNEGLTRVATTDATGAAQFEYPGGAGGIDTAIASFVDSGGVLRESVPVDVLWEPCVEPQVTLTPASQTVCSDQAAAVTATVANPIPDGILVTFEVVDGPNEGFSADAVTDVTGQAVLNYFTAGAGTDTVQASFVDDFGGVVISNQVTVTWETCVVPEVFLEPFEQQACLVDTASVTAFAFDVEPAGIPISFSVISGPNIGASGVVITNAGGSASFSYGGTAPGMDTVEASFTASDGTLQISNPVTVMWEECTPLCSATTMFGVYDQNVRDTQFFTVALDSGLSAPLGPLYDDYDIEALERDPAAGILYAIAGGDGVAGGDLFTLDPASGALDLIGNTGATGSSEIVSAAWHPDGTLWTFQQNVGLVTVDTDTAAPSFVWDPSAAGLGTNWEGLTWNRYGTALYGAQGARLYRYDPATGDAGQVCGDDFLPEPTEALGLRDDGALLGGWHNAADDTLRVFIVDPDGCSISSTEYDIPYDDVESITFDLCEPEGALSGVFFTGGGASLPRGTEVKLVAAGPDGQVTPAGSRAPTDDILVEIGMIGADGRFAFDGLPADTYTVQIDESSLPPGTLIDGYPIEVTLGPGETYDHNPTPTALTGVTPRQARTWPALWLLVGAAILLLLSGVWWRRRV